MKTARRSIYVLFLVLVLFTTFVGSIAYARTYDVEETGRVREAEPGRDSLGRRSRSARFTPPPATVLGRVAARSRGVSPGSAGWREW